MQIAVFAPELVQAGARFLLTAFAHLFEQTEEVERLAQTADPETVRQGGNTLGAAIARGQALQCQLQIETWEVDLPVQSMVWLGRPNSLEFVVTVPAEAHGAAFGRLLVSGPGGPLGRVAFQLQVGGDSDKTRHVETRALAFRNTYLAFAPKDAPLIQALHGEFTKAGWNWEPQQPGPATLEPDWEEEAFPLIQRSELFVLFWSDAAGATDRVEAEWQVALGARLADTDGLPDILAVQLEPQAPEPPDELAFLLFLRQFQAIMPPLPPVVSFDEDDLTLKRRCDVAVANGDELVFDILLFKAKDEEKNEVLALQNAWNTLRRSERLQRISAEQARTSRVQINSSILALVGRYF